MSASRDILVFEDPAVDKLRPLTLTRPAYDLRCGILTLAEKIAHHFRGRRISYHCRGYLQRVLEEESPSRGGLAGANEPVLLVNGRVIMDEDLARRLADLTGEVVFRSGEETVAASIGPSRLERMRGLFAGTVGPDVFTGWGLKEEQVPARLVHYLWDLVSANGEEIEADLGRLGRPAAHSGAVSSRAHLERRSAVHLGRARVDAGAVLDARSGPIYVGHDAHISSHTFIEGPAAIGAGCLIRPGASLAGGVTLGPVCKVGGEVESSIVQGFSNKQHAGFLGHSYLGSWVNLGAGTETSDLKNNYHPVRVVLGDEEVDTGSLFVGLMMGDHSKSAIGATFTTGAVVGAACNYFAPGASPRYIPSFTWYGPEGWSEHILEKALETARCVMARRGREFSPAYESMLREVFAQSAAERGRDGRS